MEALSNMRTIVGIAQDILATLETASRNKSRCGRVASRVRRLMDVLGELDGPGTTTDAAMRKGLEEALSRALRQVRRCQRSGGFLRSLAVAGGRMSDPLDEVESEIDRCLLDLSAASYARIARLETLLRQLNVAAGTDDDDDGDKDENKGQVVATYVEDVTAIGVPACTVAGGVHDHGREIVRLPSHGYGYCNCYWRFSYGHAVTCDCWHNYAGCPTDAPSYYNQYRPYPSVFSDDNPNASCSIL
ncbi:unnamed protein product [Urochloa humidicola]